MDEQQKAPSFEERLKTVQNLISDIENGGLSLEKSVQQYETGMRILEELDMELNEINRRITVLRDDTEKENGDEDV